MKKTITIISIGLVAILLLGAGWYFLIRNPDSSTEGPLGGGPPFGSAENVTFPISAGEQPTTDSGSRNSDQFAQPTNRLFRISDMPVAGFAFLPISTTTVRYADRGTGHITDAELSSLTKIRITNVTLPKIHEAHFRRDGTKVIYRSLTNSDVVETASITLIPPSSTSTDALHTPRATLLPDNILETTVGVGDILYFISGQNIISSNFDGGAQSILWTSPFNNWRLSSYNESLLLWTKADSHTPGYSYLLSDNRLSKVLGELYGLSISAHPTDEPLLYSHVIDGRTRLYGLFSPGSISVELYPATIAEKCAWSLRREAEVFCGTPPLITTNEPEKWYRGITRFSDEIWRFGLHADASELVVSPKNLLGIDLDVYQPQVSPNDDYLVFINKNDLSLWALRLEE